MAWILRIETTVAAADELSAALWELGTTGVAEIAELPSADGVNPSLTLLAGFASDTTASAAGSAIARWATSIAVEPVDDRAWVDDDRRARVDLPTGTVELAVGPAFGSGDHPTTRLALDLLLPLVDAGASVLDFGTGTGILAVAAATAGATKILAVDDDPAARAVAEANLANGVGAVSITVADRLPALPTPATAGFEAEFDVTVANVLLDVHREHGQQLADVTAPAGSVIVSGVLASQRAEVLAAYSSLAVAEERLSPTAARGGENDRWLALRLVAAKATTPAATASPRPPAH